MSQDDLIYSLDGNIITLTLNRPDRMNAISVELEEELHVAFDRADRDRSVRTIILTGTGNAFSAGYDMAPKGGRDADPSTRSMADYVEYWQRRDGQSVVHWSHMWGLGKPIIAAVNGWALGGGFWYALAADLTIASDRAVFGQPEVRHISRSTYLFGAVCGWKNANRWGADWRPLRCSGGPPHRHGQRGRAARSVDGEKRGSLRVALRSCPSLRCASTRRS